MSVIMNLLTAVVAGLTVRSNSALPLTSTNGSQGGATGAFIADGGSPSNGTTLATATTSAGGSSPDAFDGVIGALVTAITVLSLFASVTSTILTWKERAWKKTEIDRQQQKAKGDGAAESVGATTPLLIAPPSGEDEGEDDAELGVEMDVTGGALEGRPEFGSAVTANPLLGKRK
jgi:hypothetical protein